ncbi:MAG TPA: hypothetical protein VIY26_18265 [Acidimicrobiales bacterium]
MAGFVQVMELETSKIDDVDALGRELAAAMGPKFRARKATTAEDRERRGHYYVIVEFDSYEDAMQNSDDPMTADYAERMSGLLDGPPVFRNLDVVSVMEVG